MVLQIEGGLEGGGGGVVEEERRVEALKHFVYIQRRFKKITFAEESLYKRSFIFFL